MNLKKRLFGYSLLIAGATIFSLEPEVAHSFNIIKTPYRNQYLNTELRGDIPLFKLSTHPLITISAVKIISDEDIRREATDYLTELIEGTVNEDIPPARSLNHFYSPISGMGQALPALTWVRGKFESAKEQYNIGDKAQAYRDIGHILHIIQDLHVGEHVFIIQHITHVIGNKFEKGSKFETYAEEVYGGRLEDFIIRDKLSFSIPEIKRYGSFEAYIKETAQSTYDYYLGFLEGHNNIRNLQHLTPQQLEDIANNQIPHAISASAGFIELFYNTVNRK